MALNSAYQLPSAFGSSSMPWWSTDFGTGDPKGYGLDLSDPNMYETALKKAFLGMWPGAVGQVQNAVNLAPQVTAAQNQLSSILNPANTGALLTNMNNQVDQNTGRQQSLVGNAMANSGLSSGAVLGAQLDAANQGAAAKNANMGQLLSPQGLASTYSAYLNSLNAGSQAPLLSQMMGLAHASPPHVQSSNGWGSLLGGVSSLIPGLGGLGGMLGGLFGGGGGATSGGTGGAGYWNGVGTDNDGLGGIGSFGMGLGGF